MRYDFIDAVYALFHLEGKCLLVNTDSVFHVP
jgi:hypothetical protein